MHLKENFSVSSRFIESFKNFVYCSVDKTKIFSILYREPLCRLYDPKSSVSFSNAHCVFCAFSYMLMKFWGKQSWIYFFNKWWLGEHIGIVPFEDWTIMRLLLHIPFDRILKTSIISFLFLCRSWLEIELLFENEKRNGYWSLTYTALLQNTRRRALTKKYR